MNTDKQALTFAIVAFLTGCGGSTSTDTPTDDATSSTTTAPPCTRI
ncbi:hypothetical protein ORJ04_14910 [Rheinheimera baltica]|uniref:Uncharacterized protein n=1 Tax=Rheinheimera baltica TaxID=67576 RepID=A0ABT9I1H8_9GAMM|nr:hypothetical protein [Rheinheimera baltica]MDP5137243.1 hypothetical protein [Rheinheimera baltica]MDP5143719.1 hypothetical protein [Rheinheimera baltica]